MARGTSSASTSTIGSVRCRGTPARFAGRTGVGWARAPECPPGLAWLAERIRQPARRLGPLLALLPFGVGLVR